MQYFKNIFVIATFFVSHIFAASGRRPTVPEKLRELGKRNLLFDSKTGKYLSINNPQQLKQFAQALARGDEKQIVLGFSERATARALSNELRRLGAIQRYQDINSVADLRYFAQNPEKWGVQLQLVPTPASSIPTAPFSTFFPSTSADPFNSSVIPLSPAPLPPSSSSTGLNPTKPWDSTDGQAIRIIKDIRKGEYQNDIQAYIDANLDKFNTATKTYPQTMSGYLNDTELTRFKIQASEKGHLQRLAQVFAMQLVANNTIPSDWYKHQQYKDLISDNFYDYIQALPEDFEDSVLNKIYTSDKRSLSYISSLSTPPPASSSSGASSSSSSSSAHSSPITEFFRGVKYVIAPTQKLTLTELMQPKNQNIFDAIVLRIGAISQNRSNDPLFSNFKQFVLRVNNEGGNVIWELDPRPDQGIAQHSPQCHFCPIITDYNKGYVVADNDGALGFLSGGPRGPVVIEDSTKNVIGLKPEVKTYPKILVIPKAPIVNMGAVTASDLASLHAMTELISNLIQKYPAYQNFNLEMHNGHGVGTLPDGRKNFGGGQTVFHLHWHVRPDTNDNTKAAFASNPLVRLAAPSALPFSSSIASSSTPTPPSSSGGASSSMSHTKEPSDEDIFDVGTKVWDNAQKISEQLSQKIANEIENEFASCSAGINLISENDLTPLITEEIYTKENFRRPFAYLAGLAAQKILCNSRYYGAQIQWGPKNKKEFNAEVKKRLESVINKKQETFDPIFITRCRNYFRRIFWYLTDPKTTIEEAIAKTDSEIQNIP